MFAHHRLDAPFLGVFAPPAWPRKFHLATNGGIACVVASRHLTADQVIVPHCLAAPSHMAQHCHLSPRAHDGAPATSCRAGLSLSLQYRMAAFLAGFAYAVAPSHMLAMLAHPLIPTFSSGLEGGTGRRGPALTLSTQEAAKPRAPRRSAKTRLRTILNTGGN